MNKPYMLFVDDDPHEVDIVLDMFAEHDMEHRIRFAHNGVEALNKLEYFQSMKIFMHSTGFDSVTAKLCQFLGTSDLIRKTRDNEALRNLVRMVTELA